MIDEIRPDRRLRWSADIEWQLEGRATHGHAVVVDVSRDGAQLLFAEPFDGQADDIVLLSAEGLEGVLPPRASVRWTREVPDGSGRLKCGLRFIDADPVVWPMWIKTLAVREAARRAEFDAALRQAERDGAGEGDTLRASPERFATSSLRDP